MRSETANVPATLWAPHLLPPKEPIWVSIRTQLSEAKHPVASPTLPGKSKGLPTENSELRSIILSGTRTPRGLAVGVADYGLRGE